VLAILSSSSVTKSSSTDFKFSSTSVPVNIRPDIIIYLASFAGVDSVMKSACTITADPTQHGVTVELCVYTKPSVNPAIDQSTN